MVKAVAFILVLASALTWTGASSALAQDQIARAQISAATDNAITTLRTNITSEHITSTLTVGQFIDQTNSGSALDQAIQGAQQIGGPRWIDPQTCQVRLEISGARISATLVSIAADQSAHTPIPAGALQQRLADWQRRSFVAVGTSVTADRASSIKPPELGPRWRVVSDDAREQAIAAARKDGAQRVIDTIRPIEFTRGKTFGDILSQDSVEQNTRDWLASRPVTQLRFREDLQVEVTEATPPDELFQTILNSASRVPGTTLPADEASLGQLRTEFARRVSPELVGRATVNPEAVQHAPIMLPSQPPPWLSQVLEAIGSAAPGPSPLRTKSVAEANATENLRARVGQLPLARGLTIAEAAQQDPRVADAVNRALLRSHVSDVKYRADGSFEVHMTVRPSDLWDELRQAVGQ